MKMEVMPLRYGCELGTVDGRLTMDVMRQEKRKEERACRA